MGSRVGITQGSHGRYNAEHISQLQRPEYGDLFYVGNRNFHQYIAPMMALKEIVRVEIENKKQEL